MDKSTARIVDMLKQEMISPAAMTHLLLEYAREDRSSLDDLIGVLKTDSIIAVYDITSMYPQTDVGWNILPLSREPLLRPDLGSRELADVNHRQYQEDRPHVEYLRTRLEPLR